MDSDKLLNLATSLGCLLAESGAEISRVEESVYRLLQAYQCCGYRRPFAGG